MKATEKKRKKKVTAVDVVKFIAIYMGVSIGMNFLCIRVIQGKPFDTGAFVSSVMTGIGLMVGRQILWAIEQWDME